MATERDGWKHASEQLPLVNARQRQILDLIERGHTNQEIADHFDMTLAGAKWHVSDLLSKLGLSTREEMAEFWAWRRSRRTFRPFGAFTTLPPKIADAFGVAALATSIVVPWLLLRGGAEEPSSPSATPTAALLAQAPTVPPSTGVTSFAVPLPQAGPEGLLAYIAANGDLMVKPMPSGAPTVIRKSAHLRTPTWSPSGEYLAFVEEGWLVLMTGTGRTMQVTQVNDGGWAWSPTGDTLAYFTPDGLFLFDAVAGSAHIIRGQGAPYPENPGGGFWSPDGTRILYGFFASYSGPNRPEATELRIYDTRGGSDTLLREDRLPAQAGTVPLGWSGDGKWVFYREPPGFGNSAWVGSVDVHVIPATGGTPMKLGSTDGFADHFSTPAGSALAAYVNGGFRFATDSGRKVEVVSDGVSTALSDGPPGTISAVAFSSGALRLATVAMPEPPVRTGSFGPPEMQAQLMGEKLWVLTIGGPARQLTDDSAYRDEHPVWSRDGQSILFARIDATGKASLWQIPAAGGQPELVQDGLGFGPTGVGGLYGWIEWSDLLAWWQP